MYRYIQLYLQGCSVCIAFLFSFCSYFYLYSLVIHIPELSTSLYPHSKKVGHFCPIKGYYTLPRSVLIFSFIFLPFSLHYLCLFSIWVHLSRRLAFLYPPCDCLSVYTILFRCLGFILSVFIVPLYRFFFSCCFLFSFFFSS